MKSPTVNLFMITFLVQLNDSRIFLATTRRPSVLQVTTIFMNYRVTLLRHKNQPIVLSASNAIGIAADTLHTVVITQRPSLRVHWVTTIDTVTHESFQEQYRRRCSTFLDDCWQQRFLSQCGERFAVLHKVGSHYPTLQSFQGNAWKPQPN